MKLSLNKILIIICFLSVSYSDVYDGYFLFAPSSSNEDSVSTLLMDNEYDVIHSWEHTLLPASMPYLLPDSTLLFPGRVQDPEYMDVSSAGGRLIKWRA